MQRVRTFQSGSRLALRARAVPRRGVALAIGGAMGLVACADTSTTPPPAADVAGDAFVVATRVRTSDSRAVYVRVSPDLAPREFDLGAALEVTGQARVYTYGGKVYVADSENVTVRRFRVAADFNLDEELVFSMQGEGVTRFRSTFTFVRDDLAFYLDYNGYQAIVFNPTEMTLRETIDLRPVLERDGFGVGGVAGEVVGDRLLAAFSWTSTDDAVRTVSVLSIGIDDGSVAVIEDDRCFITGGFFVDEADDFYVAGTSGDGVYDVFSSMEEAPPCLLRVRDGRFDPDYQVDLRTLTGSPHVSGLVGRRDGKFVIRAYDDRIDPTSFDAPIDYLSAEVWRWHRGDLATETSADLGLPVSGISNRPWVVDDAFFLPVLDEETQTTVLYRVSSDDVSESVTATGDVQTVARVQ
ncbi:MAG: hypothetical protein AAF715_23345 [Myxococcota bacterium]